MIKFTKNIFKVFIIVFAVMVFSPVAWAGSTSGLLTVNNIWDGWTEFQNDDVNDGNGEDYVYSNEYVDPGWGGQDFDAEYLFYKLDGTMLSIGLQTGFDVVSGLVHYGGKDYYAGDIALSFDGSTDYTYALDFGTDTKDYYGNSLVTDTAGLYSVSSWNTGVYSGFTASNPFAMASGTLETGLTWETGSGTTINSDISYYRIASFDISDYVLNDVLNVNAHWTMSCGNDAINGSFAAPVPEPSTLILLGSGLLGLAFYRKKQGLKQV